MATERKTLKQLFIPIWFETVFHMLAGIVDTMMLSSVGDQTVGAVGTANTYISVFIVMFSIISSGMLAVMTQNIGAGRPGVAYQARQLGLMFNVCFGVVMSCFLSICARNILSVVGVADALMAPAESYLRIVGAGCIFNATIPIFSGYLRAFGYTKQSLYSAVTGNVINLGLNAIFLFALHKGVEGVATATVISRGINLLMLVFFSTRLIKAKTDTSRLKPAKILGQIVKIGLPSALETIIYNIAMTLVIRFLNQMDPDGVNVAARSYTNSIVTFSYSVGVGLAQANAIMTGWRIGAGDYEACDRGTKKAALMGVIVGATMETLTFLLGGFIMRFFSDDPQMVSLVTKLLAVDIALEVGRATNLVFGSALKTSGDALFPVIIAAIMMFLCSVGGTYIFGIKLELMAVGAYIGLAADECVRAVLMFLRWRSGAWKKKSLIKKEQQPA